MGWIALSLLAMVLICGQVLTIKWASQKTERNSGNNNAIAFSVFAPTFVVALTLSILSGDALLVGGSDLVILITAGFFGSYIGALSANKSLAIAPNAGYSQTIISCYLIVSTIGAAIIFNDDFSTLRVTGIVIILISCAFIAIDKVPKHLTKDSRWLYLALLCNVCFGYLALANRKVFESGFSGKLTLTYVCGVALIAILTRALFEKSNLLSLAPIRSISVGVSSASFNIFLFAAFQAAPNIGYVSAIVAISNSIICVISYFLFKDKLTKLKMLGVLGSIAGATLLLI